MILGKKDIQQHEKEKSAKSINLYILTTRLCTGIYACVLHDMCIVHVSVVHICMYVYICICMYVNTCICIFRHC